MSSIGTPLMWSLFAAFVLVALLVDLWVFHSVFINPTSSTAGLAMIWFPLWNMLIFVPAATWIAWLIHRRRRAIAQASQR